MLVEARCHSILPSVSNINKKLCRRQLGYMFICKMVLLMTSCVGEF